MNFYISAVRVSGCRFLKNFEAENPPSLPEPLISLLLKLCAGECSAHILFTAPAHEQDCACCSEEAESEFISLVLTLKNTAEIFLYRLTLFVPHEIIFEEMLKHNGQILFKKESSEISFPQSNAMSLSERSDYLYLPVSAKKEIALFRQILQKTIENLPKTS